MSKTGSLFTVLQHADSFFPGGQVSFSWGLEELAGAERIKGADALFAFIGGQVRARWASADRAVLVAAHQADGNLDAVADADRVQEAMSLSAGMREGSARMGRALLSVHEELGTPGAGEYRARVRADRAPGHVAAVQGLVWQGAGLSRGEAEAASAHGLCVGLLGAALRLGLIGHLDGQRILTRLQPCLAEVMARPAPPLAEAGAYAPAIDITIMIHETKTSRLFST
jgi:urease accessory protein